MPGPEFLPPQHKNLETLNDTLEFARKCVGSQNVQDHLTAVLIFTNQVEYMLRDILLKLRRMTRTAMYKVTNAVFFWPSSVKLRNMTIGALVKNLEEFNFPDKEGFLRDATQFNAIRNGRVHNMLLSKDMISKADLETMAELFENIFSRYDNIDDAIIRAWPAPLKLIKNESRKQQLDLPSPPTVIPSDPVVTSGVSNGAVVPPSPSPDKLDPAV